jgi:small subunit ribosomal protein S16
MLRIRLRRVGKKKQPMYRIVVADSRSPRDGDFVESIGYYHPLDNPSTIVLDQERAKQWLDKGAQPSDRVAKILAIQGVAEIPKKLATRIALGEQRAKEAASAAKDAAKAEAAPAAAAEAAPAPAAQAAPEAPAPEAAPEAPAPDAAAQEPPAEAPVEEPAQE